MTIPMIRTQASFLFGIGILGGMFAPCLAAQIEHSRSILRAQEFIDNPSLMAHARQTFILDNDPNPFEEPVIRYELEEGKHDFCLSGDQPYFMGMVLEDVWGQAIFTMPSYERCITATLSSGLYSLRILHPERQDPDPERSAFVQVDIPGPPVADAHGSPVPGYGFPVPGYWAIQPDPALDTQHRAGRLRAQPPFQNLLNDGFAYAPVVADFSSPVMDEYSLFHVLSGNTYDPAILQAKETYWSLVSKGLIFGTDYALIGNTCGYLDCTYSYYQTLLKDLGNNKFQIFYLDNQTHLLPYFFSDDGFAHSELTINTSDRPPATFRVVFRFFPDGTQIGNLYPGEAALFQTCGYTGRAAVFAYGTADLSAVSSPATTVDHSAKAVRLGNNTGLLWRTASSRMAIAGNTACLPEGVEAPGGNDVQVLPLDLLLSDPANAGALDKKCVNCKLEGANLNGIALQGWDLSGIDFSGATLANVKLNSANLTGAHLAGAILQCADFSGADQSRPADLTHLDFTKVHFANENGCKSNFTNTLLSVALFPPELWKYANLANATFTDAKGKQLSSAAHPLDLSGVTLTGVSLEGVILDYATGLAGADLTQARLNGASLQHVNLGATTLHATTLYGAQLVNANLDGANLSGAVLTKSPSGGVAAANLQGAFLRNVNLSKAQLSGANFTNASFYGTTAAGTCIPDSTGFTNHCATAAGAAINNTQFSNAYLFGVDFTSAQIQGVQFANAVLAGANFAGATLSADSSVGTNSGFSGAFLQGTNLAAAKSLVGISLAGAFVDFSPQGNTMYLKLGGQHTVFAGYWNTPGQGVCAEAAYSGPTIVPTNNSSIICPNGNSYPKGCGAANTDGSNLQWKSPVDITQVASYQFDSTYTKAPAAGNAICAFDPKWIGGETAQPGEPRRPHPTRPEPRPRQQFDFRRLR